MVQIKSRRSGNWDDPKTWVGGKVPRSGDHVTIRSGHEVVPSAKTKFSGGSVQIEDGAVFNITKTSIPLGLRDGVTGGRAAGISGGGGRGLGIKRED